MDRSQFQKIRDLFNRCRRLDPPARDALLETECKDDPELRREVQELVAADAAPLNFGPLTVEVETASAGAAQFSDYTGQSIGPYKVLEKLGEGGMGIVYLAEQSEPIRRQVALKVIKLGMDTKAVVARFESERQALAMMDHPNVARVLDAGATAEGRPYFVMEHVQGESITAYCDRHRVTTQERLKLFMAVCHAVQHAHQKAIIHRDLKPSNILVAVKDGQPIAKVIDFGVAKATQQKLTEKTLFTEQGLLIGTPEYMSPEQAEMSALNVDTRTDIYSLGVVLYELLVGALPFDPGYLRRAAFGELQRIIREEDPPKPSTRLSSLGNEDSNTAASKRRTDIAGLERQLRGDLDWITLKAMNKDRTQRYETANGLAQDIGRYLRMEPVLATPPGPGYRLRKFVKRNKGPVAGACVIMLVLVVATAVSIGFALSEIEQRRLAEAAEQKQVRARQEAEDARAETEKRADELKTVTRFQQSMIADIDAERMGLGIIAAQREDIRKGLESAGVDPQEIEAGLATYDTLVKETNATNLALRVVDENVLARAAQAIQEQFANQPIIQAALQGAVAETYFQIGLYQHALPLQESVLRIRRAELGEDHEDTLASLNSLGFLFHGMGQHDKALPYWRESLKGCRRALGDDHPHTLSAINNMGILMQSMGRYEEALSLYREALEGSRRIHGDDHKETLTSLGNVGLTLKQLGRHEEALPYTRDAMDGRRRVLGEDHPDTLYAIESMGNLLRVLARYEQSRTHFDEALDGYRRVRGDEHPDTLTTINNIGSLLNDMGKKEEALAYWQEALDGRRRALGVDHWETLGSMNNVGLALQKMGRKEQALPYFTEALGGLRRVMGNDHPHTLGAIGNMGFLLEELGRKDEAMVYTREALEGFRRSLGNDHPETLNAINNMAGLLQSMGRREEAMPYNREALAGLRHVMGDQHPHTVGAIKNMGIQLQALGRLEEALPIVRESLEGHRRILGDEHNSTLGAMAGLGVLLLKMERFDEAEAVLRECHDARQRLLPEDNWLRWEVQSRLGSAVLGQARALAPSAAAAARAKFVEAESLLIEGYERLQPPVNRAARKPAALERIVTLYEAWHAVEPDAGHAARASEWRAKRTAPQTDGD